jgi:DNA topoisomerase-1
MTTKYNLKTTLVIVESPAKCKKIEEYLGPGYKCLASFGHLRTITSLKDIDIANGFEPTYHIIDDDYKPKQIELLRKQIEISDEVIIATDDDREGESIGWSICKLFGLPIETTKRIIFHEVTESAILHAMKNPYVLSMNKVYSQQSRQILDLLVGFNVTPMLWKYISKKNDKGLSAGRCQTPALRLIYDNYLKNKELENGTKVYSVSGYFTNKNLLFQLNKPIEREDMIQDYFEDTVNFEHIYSCSEPKRIVKQSPTPFTTSSLQQTASNELHYSPKETMKCCQELYENGYITYMRTDCNKYSDDFIKEANNFILKNYSSDYIKNDTTTNPRVANVNAQLAHEAIRPTSIYTKTIPDTATAISQKSSKVYNLIWRNTVESCMTDSIYNTIVASITGPFDSIYKYSSEQMLFAGWKIVSKKDVDKDEKAENYNYLLTIKQNMLVEYRKVIVEETIKNLPSHYTEAYLVQLLEKEGIGRPSTFAMLIDKIQDRNYVKKTNIEGKKIACKDYFLENDELTEVNKEKIFGSEKNKLVIQPLGIIVIEFLIKHYSSLFDYKYTEKMENALEHVADGFKNWQEVCKEVYSEINKCGETLLDEIKCNIKIDDNNYYIIGKHGPVIKQTDKDGNITFRQVKPDIDIKKLENGEYKLSDVLEKITSNNLGKYQNEDLIVRKGKFGLYVTWGDNSKSLTCFGNRPLENITFPEVFEILEKDGVMDPNKSVGFLREITANISIRRGKYGDYIFYKTSKMKSPKFYKLDGFKDDYRNCEKALIIGWIKVKYEIS